MNQPIDHEYTKNIVCPHCGHEIEDSFEFGVDSGNEKCSKCDKEFFFERYTEVIYSTRKEC